MGGGAHGSLYTEGWCGWRRAQARRRLTLDAVKTWHRLRLRLEMTSKNYAHKSSVRIITLKNLYFIDLKTRLFLPFILSFFVRLRYSILLV